MRIKIFTFKVNLLIHLELDQIKSAIFSMGRIISYYIFAKFYGYSMVFMKCSYHELIFKICISRFFLKFVLGNQT